MINTVAVNLFRLISLSILNAHAGFRGELYSYSLFPLLLRLLQRISSGEKGKEKQTIFRGVGKNIKLLVTYTPRIKLILGTGITGSIFGFSKSIHLKNEGHGCM